jgi:hypothetical protein
VVIGVSGDGIGRPATRAKSPEFIYQSVLAGLKTRIPGRKRLRKKSVNSDQLGFFALHARPPQEKKHDERRPSTTAATPFLHDPICNRSGCMRNPFRGGVS